MDDTKLVDMANQIARFFQSYPPAEASASIADHLIAFWTPAMCRELASRIERTRGQTEPLVVQAVLTPQFRTAIKRGASVYAMADDTG